MNRKMAEALIEKDCFEYVMTAMRGPDKEDDAELKLPFTAVLRWTVGFNYGKALTPNNKSFEGIDIEEQSHFVTHISAALYRLYRWVGWSISRVPLVAYFDRQEAKVQAVKILENVGCHIRTPHLGHKDCPAEMELLQSCLDKVADADPETDPDFHLTLPNY